MIAGGTRRSSSPRGGRPSRRRTVSVTNSGFPLVRSTSASTSAPAEFARSELGGEGRDVRACKRFEHHLGAEPAQLDQGGAERGRGRRVLRPVGHEQTGPTLPGRGRVVHEHRHGGRVGPVGVVEDAEHRRGRRGVANPTRHGVELGDPSGGRVTAVRRGGQVAAVDRAEQLSPRPQPRQDRRLRGGRPRHLPPVSLRVEEHGVAQRRLAHPRLARDEHDPADALGGAAAQLGDPAQLPVAPVQPRLAFDHGRRVWRPGPRNGRHRNRAMWTTAQPAVKQAAASGSPCSRW